MGAPPLGESVTHVLRICVTYVVRILCNLCPGLVQPHSVQITLTLCILDVWGFGYYSSKLLVQPDISPTNDKAYGEAGRVNWKYPKPNASSK